MDDAAVRKKIRDAYEASQSQNYYELLGVDPEADAAAIKGAFRKLIRQWHTDRFARYELSEDAALLEALLAAINEANQILSDADKRAAYDEALAGGGDQEVSAEEFAQIFEADDAFRKGKNLVERGEYKAAAAKFKICMQVNPEDPETQAYYGFSRFMNEPMMPNGERSSASLAHHAELKRLATEHKDSAIAQLYYAKTLKILGKRDQAIRAFEKATALAPNNTDAARELRLIKMRSPDKDTKGGGLLGKLRGLFKKS